MAKAKKAKKRTKKTARKSKATPAAAPPPAPVVPKTSAELEPLRERVRQAHARGTKAEMTAACRALVDAGDKTPPQEAYATLKQWGEWPG